jgi:hypothetical protein
MTVDYVRGSRNAGVEADPAIVVHPGIASNPADLDSFCAHHADRGVDVWTPDDRSSPVELRTYPEDIKSADADESRGL